MSESFIHELPLKTDLKEEAMIEVRLDGARQLYNGVLKEARRRVALIKQSSEWQKAKKLIRSKARSALFRSAIEHHQFSEYCLHAFVKNLLNESWIKDHIDSQVAQKVATRVYQAMSEHLKGKRGYPRMKGKGQFCSVEGKSNVTGIRFKNGIIHWKGLTLKPLYDLKDRYGIEAHALAHKTKYVRLVKRRIRGKARYFAQVIQSGKPLIKGDIGKDQSVALDIGPSAVAIVSEKHAELRALCTAQLTKTTHCQRALDRSKRACNPDNFDKKGRPKRGVPWSFSKRYIGNKNKLAEAQRVFAETRKSEHGRLVNQILSLGNTIKLESLSYKSFQKNYGRSVVQNAPGMLIQILRRKAENAGGKVIEFSTYKTKLSQTCHACASVRKKKLSERFHRCNCGIECIQRDLYSAFLALYVDDDEILDRSQASMAWASAVPLLQQALSRAKQTAIGKHWRACFGFSQRQSCSSVKGGSTASEAKDVVRRGNASSESFGELVRFATRTPVF
jgi:transposase